MTDRPADRLCCLAAERLAAKEAVETRANDLIAINEALEQRLAAYDSAAKEIEPTPYELERLRLWSPTVARSMQHLVKHVAALRVDKEAAEKETAALKHELDATVCEAEKQCEELRRALEQIVLANYVYQAKEIAIEALASTSPKEGT